MNSESRNNIFISYAHEDIDSATEIYSYLNEHGLNPWLDKFSLPPGQFWELAIRKVISNSEFFLPCISKYALLKDGFIKKEIQTALSFVDEEPVRSIYIIPVRIEPCEIPVEFLKEQYYDWYDPNQRIRLINNIQTTIEQEHQNRIFNKLNQQHASRINLLKQYIYNSFHTLSPNLAFYTYTDHYINHAERLVQTANNLIPDSTLNEFSSTELFVLLSSIYLHDIGMSTGSSNKSEMAKIRNSHGEMSQEYIKRNKYQLALTPDEANIIGNVSKAHSKPHLSSIQKIMSIGTTKIRLRFLAALLRLLDVLDIDQSRAPSLPFYLNSMGQAAKDQWRINHSINRVEYYPNENTINIIVNTELDDNPNQLRKLFKKKTNEILNCFKTFEHEFKANNMYYNNVHIIFKAIENS